MLLKMIVLCVCSLGLAAGVAAQNEYVTIPSPDITLKQALEELRRQTGYMPVVNYDNVDPLRSVTLSSNDLSAEELLRQVLAGTGFTHKLMGRRILIIPAPPAIDDGKGARSAMWRTDDENDESVEMEVITFRAGVSRPEAGFMDNDRTFAWIGRMLADTAVVAWIDHISVTAASSPDGNTANNERLAIERALATKGYLVRRYPHIAPEKIYAFSVGEEWTGLGKLVEEDVRTPYRDEVLRILENLPEEEKRDSIRALGGGRAWRYMASRLFPRLRGAAAVTLHFKNALTERRIDTIGVANYAGSGMPSLAGSGVQRVEILAAKPAPRPVEPPVAEPVPVVERSPLLALKTNLLFDAAGILNLEAEVPVGSKWSIAGEVVLPWWMQIGGTLEARYWWGGDASRPPLTGWFTGAYFGGGSYDFSRDSRARRGDFFHAGISGGYAHTINRNGRLRMEYSLGAGYLWGTRRLDTEREKYRWIGPTRAKVSLVLMLDRKSTSK